MVSDPPSLPSRPVLTVTTAEHNVGLSMETLPYPSCEKDANTHLVGFTLENPYDNGNTHLVEEANHSSSQAFSFDQSNWDGNMQNLQDQHQPFPVPTPPDLLNLLYLPCSSPISFENPTHKTINLRNPSGHGELHDPFLHLNLPAHPPPALRELFQSLPHGYILPPAASKDDFLFAGEGDREGSEDERDFDNGIVLKFTQDLASVGGKGKGKKNKQVTTEKQRRVEFSGKFDALRELIPNPTKNDRASVLGDAIGYIKELRRTVNDLKLLVDKKRCGKERIKKRHKVEEGDASGELESCNLKPLGDPDDQAYNGCIRSSWLQRKSKDTEVDVRIIDDEVTIKLVQRKKINCLLYASKVLDELQLDLQHVAGGHIGDFCSFLFNSKIYEGSSVYASAIANRLIEVMDRSFQAA